MKIFGLLALFLLAACSDEATDQTDYTASGEPAQGDMYVTAALGGATNLVPWLAGESGSTAITQHIYESLLTYDKNLALEGQLAERWDVSADGQVMTFHLRQDVQWHDGTPFTAADVKATFDAITYSATRTPYAGDYQRVDKLEVVDDHTVRVHYPAPFAPALASWAGLAILPAHILKLDDDVNETRLRTAPVGTGPYKLSQWDAQTEAVLTANPAYYDGVPYIETVRIRVIPDADTQFLELKAGRLDAMSLKPVQYTRLTDGDDFARRFAKYSYLGFGYTYVGLNLKHELFTDKTVRQALSYATPRAQLVKGILHGQGTTLASVFKPGTWAHDPSLQVHSYNLDKARALLTQAGWLDTDDDGVRDKGGRPFRFTLVTNQGNDQRIKTAQILQHVWEKIGIDVDIQVQEWRTFLENTLYPRNFEAYILGWSLTPEPDPYDIWHSSKQGAREFNLIGFENAAADQLMEDARQTFDREKRKALLYKFQRILHEEQPTLILYAPYSLLAIHRRFKGIEPAPAGVTHNFHEWYVPAAQQMY